MANIIPFKGLRYNQEKICNLASVVTPPYDIIDETAQARYYAENPNNIIRLELGLSFPKDTIDNNRYTRASQYLEKWIEDETLIVEKKPAIYVYQQEFVFQEKKVVRTGFICGIKVEQYENGKILPHEQTLTKPKKDRLQLMQATQSNFSSIFGLFSDSEKYIDNLLLEHIKGKMPEINITDDANEVHRIWVIDNEDIIGKIVEVLSDKKIYIADGHHRYETALEYAMQMKQKGHKGYDYVMATLVNLYDEGLVVLPTHRIVGKIKNFKFSQFKKDLKKLFDLTLVGNKENLKEFSNGLIERGKYNHVFGMYVDKNLYFLTLKDKGQTETLLPQDKSAAWKNLDVAILDNLILDQMLGIGEKERSNQDNLVYSRSEEQVVKYVDNKTYQLGFMLNPTLVEEIVNVAQARDKMPQKSTYFYPKLITGLVLNKLNI